MPLRPFRNHPIRIQPYFGFRNRDRLTISCRALRSGKRDAGALWEEGYADVLVKLMHALLVI